MLEGRLLLSTTNLQVAMSDDSGASSGVLVNGAYATLPTIGTATVGNAIHYTIVVSNNGPGATDADGVSIVDVVPAATFDNAVGWNCTASSTGSAAATGFTASAGLDGDGNQVPGAMPNIYDTGVTLPAGGAITYILTATPSSQATSNVIQAANVSFSGTDPDSSNNTATDEGAIPEAISAIIVPDQTDVVPGEQVYYTIVISNDGQAGVGGINVTDSILTSPSGANLLPNSVIFGANGSDPNVYGQTPAGYSVGGAAVNDTGIYLPYGSSISYMIVGAVNQAATEGATLDRSNNAFRHFSKIILTFIEQAAGAGV